MKETYAAIMAGGIGSRFWPKSRQSFPKQFLDILGTGETLIQSTYDRLKKVVPAENIFVLTNESYRPLVKEQLEGIEDSRILGEPMRKNTAPCIAYFANKVLALNPDANMIISPADHLVMKNDHFVEILNSAIKFSSENEALLTLGITPTRPETGYGYIQFLEEKKKDDAYKVKTFTEKPNEKLAKTFVKSGEFLWNSGIFIWSAKAIVKEFTEHLPEIQEVFSQEKKKIYNTDLEAGHVKKAFSMCPNVSIDYGIMEKSDNVYVVPADLGWSDLGTWNSLYHNYEKDYLGNAVNGKNVVVFDTTNSMILAPNDKLVVLQGLDKYIVVDTKDVLMICNRKQEQEVKQIVADIKRQKGERFL